MGTLNMNSKIIISFVGLKNILYQLNLIEKDKSLDFKRACKILNINFADEIKLSLTSSAGIKNQIRFYTYNKIKRELIKIIKSVLKYNSIFNLEINSYSNLDDGTKLFLELFNKLFPEKIIVKIANLNMLDENIQYTNEESKINNFIKHNIVNKDSFDFLIKKAESYLNIGDFFTALEILNFLEEYDNSIILYSLFSVAYNMKEDDIKSKYYLEKWYELGSNDERANSLYSLSMLYSRHIKSFRLDIKKGLDCIEEGYLLLNKIRKIDNIDNEINKIFNRNGLAFYLFKDKKYNEAIELEKQLIQKLEYFDTDRVLLQKSVLMYNLGQCYSAKKDYDNAIDTYKKLIEIDPYFAEYHLEMAKIYIEINDLESALHSLKIANSLDSTMTQVFSLLGYIYYKENNLYDALYNYEEAYTIDKDNIEIIYDYLFILTELNNYKEALKILNKLTIYEKLENIDIISIVSEIYYNNNLHEAAIDILFRGIEKYGNNDILLENIKSIKSE